jgi:hypothetical protein
VAQAQGGHRRRGDGPGISAAVLQPTERKQHGSKKEPRARKTAPTATPALSTAAIADWRSTHAAERGALGTFRGHLHWFSLAPSSAMGTVITTTSIPDRSPLLNFFSYGGGTAPTRYAWPEGCEAGIALQRPPGQ